MAQQLHQRAADSLFEQLYRAHVDDVYRYSLAITRNAADTEDVVQTTFMNAYRALERGESPIDARSWLIAIARNVCRQRYRRAASRPSEVLLREELVDGVMRDEDSPTASEIQHALLRLVPVQREALVMRELEGRSYNEIAKRLGLTISAVESALFRARRALREQMESQLSCEAAQASISLQRDGRLPGADRGLLRGHLRACPACRSIARKQRAQRRGWRALAALPVPSWLGSMLGGGSGIGAGVALKAAAVTAVVAGGGGGTYTLVQHQGSTTRPRVPARHVQHTPPVTVRPPAVHVPAGQAKVHASARHRRAAAQPHRPHQPARHTVPASTSSSSTRPAQRPVHQPIHPTHPTHPVQAATSHGGPKVSLHTKAKAAERGSANTNAKGGSKGNGPPATPPGHEHADGARIRPRT